MIGNQTLSPIGRGSAVTIVFTCALNGSTVGQNYGFYLRRVEGDPTLLAGKDTALLGGVTAVSLGSGTTPAVYAASLARADTTLEPDNYYWSFERIDAGAEDVVAWGYLPVQGSARG